jgi:hypothetical protein
MFAVTMDDAKVIPGGHSAARRTLRSFGETKRPNLPDLALIERGARRKITKITLESEVLRRSPDGAPAASREPCGIPPCHYSLRPAPFGRGLTLKEPPGAQTPSRKDSDRRDPILQERTGNIPSLDLGLRLASRLPVEASRSRAIAGNE